MRCIIALTKGSAGQQTLSLPRNDTAPRADEFDEPSQSGLHETAEYEMFQTPKSYDRLKNVVHQVCVLG